MEPRARKAETTLSTLSQEIQKFQDIGFAFEELAEFYQGVQVVAQRHTIKPGELRGRLLHELETLDKGLGLETLIKTKQLELNKAEQAVAETKKELETTKAVVSSLKQEKTNLEASIKNTREKVSGEMAKITPLAMDVVNQLVEELRRGHDESLVEVRRLRDEALEVGKEVGRYEQTLQANQWLADLLALVQGDESIEGKRVRVIVLSALRGSAVWLKRHSSESYTLSSLSSATDSLIRELEQWKV
jgi:chromosome segregation ATPase